MTHRAHLRLDPEKRRYSRICGCFTERWQDGTVAFTLCDRHFFACEESDRVYELQREQRESEEQPRDWRAR